MTFPEAFVSQPQLQCWPNQAPADPDLGEEALDADGGEELDGEEAGQGADEANDPEPVSGAGGTGAGGGADPLRAERRRLFGRWGALLASQPLSGDPYRPEVSERLYGDVLLSAAEQALLAGENMIVDATFLRRSQRHRFQQLARRCGVRCRILDCRVSEAVAASRIERRQRQGTDPSEANLTVLRAQWDQREPLEAEELEVSLVVDLDGGLEQQTWTWLLTQLGGFGAAATRLIDPDLT